MPGILTFAHGFRRGDRSKNEEPIEPIGEFKFVDCSRTGWAEMKAYGLTLGLPTEAWPGCLSSSELDVNSIFSKNRVIKELLTNIGEEKRNKNAIMREIYNNIKDGAIFYYASTS